LGQDSFAQMSFSPIRGDRQTAFEELTFVFPSKYASDVSCRAIVPRGVEYLFVALLSVVFKQSVIRRDRQHCMHVSAKRSYYFASPYVALSLSLSIYLSLSLPEMNSIWLPLLSSDHAFLVFTLLPPSCPTLYWRRQQQRHLSRGVNSAASQCL
jgi:hypothetical protein